VEGIDAIEKRENLGPGARNASVRQRDVQRPCIDPAVGKGGVKVGTGTETREKA
jgi:hypothetical protein